MPQNGLMAKAKQQTSNAHGKTTSNKREEWHRALEVISLEESQKCANDAVGTVKGAGRRAFVVKTAEISSRPARVISRQRR